MPYEVIQVDNEYLLEESSLILYGDSGIGKTTITRGMPNPLYLFMRGGGEHRAAPLHGTGISVIEIQTRQQMEEVLLDLKKDVPIVPHSVIDLKKDFTEVASELQDNSLSLGGGKIKTIVIDQLTTMYNIFMGNIMKNVSRKRENPETPAQADYGQVRRSFTNFLIELNNIPNLHKVYLSLAEIDEDEQTRERYGAPMIPGKLAREVLAFTDFVFRMHNRREVMNNKFIEYRAFQTQPDGIWLAKDSTGRLPKFIKIPSPDYNFWENEIVKALKEGIQ